ncbi:hypothetical protein FACS18942_07460 [Planctomycetales bacterium]|nr:hypothetical protein FACS18942_07460 [Planctomycetales bacterium]
MSETNPAIPPNMDVSETAETTAAEPTADAAVIQKLQDMQNENNKLKEYVKNLRITRESLDNRFEKLQTKIGELESSIRFTSDFVQKIEDERVKTLYAENEKYKAGLVKRFEDELLTNVIRQIDEAEKSVRSIESRTSAGLTIEEVLASVQEIIADFKDMLQDRYNLTAFTSTIGAVADERHRITQRKETTADSELNGKIAKSVTCGYKNRDGQVFRQEAVVLYKYESSVNTEAPAKSDASVVDTASESAVGAEAKK